MSILKWGRSSAFRAGRWGFGGWVACAVLATAGLARAADSVVDAVTGGSVDSDSAAYKDVTEAAKRFVNGDLKATLSLLKDAKDAHKLLPPAEYMYAQLLIAKNEGQAAQQELEACIRLHPEDPEAYLVFADQSFANGMVTSAELLFAKAKELATTFNENAKRKRNFLIRAEAGLAAVADARENWEAAKKHYSAWLAIVDPPNANPRDPAASVPHTRLGRVLFLEDKSEDNKTGATAAYKEFVEANMCDPKSASPDILLAQLYEGAGNHKFAKLFVDKAVHQHLAADKDARLNTLLAAARWAIDTNQADEAKEYTETALKTDPNSLDAKLFRGIAARFYQDRVTAEKYLAEVYAASPGNFVASNQYAQVLAEQNSKEKRQKALEIAGMNEKAFGGQSAGQNRAQAIETAATLGWVLYQRGDITKADQVMQAIVRTNAPSADSLYYRACILQDVGKSQDAYNYVDTALKISKSFVHRHEAEEMKKSLAKVVRTTDTSDETKKEKETAPDTSSNDKAGKASTETIGPSKTGTPGGK